jgi:hypothetical protein
VGQRQLKRLYLNASSCGFPPKAFLERTIFGKPGSHMGSGLLVRAPAGGSKWAGVDVEPPRNSHILS